MIRSIASSAVAWMVLANAPALLADTVETQDGSRLQGEIVQIYEDTLVFETSFAGKLEIPLAEVMSFTSDDPEQVRFQNGTTAVGPVRSLGGGQISVATGGGAVTGRTAEVAAAWAPGAQDPAVAAREAELEGQLRKWAYETAVGLTGRYGNTEKSDYAAAARATLEGPSDRLELYVGWQYAEAENAAGEVDRTTDEIIGGVAYTNFFRPEFGWYVREELERDTFENIDFRSTTAAGLTYRPIDEETRSLELRGGLSLRYEGYTVALNNGTPTDLSDDISSDSFPGLDFGLKHYWKFADWGEMTNSLTFNPAFEDFGNYRLDHLSAVDLPLGASDFWKLRVSLQNQYNSEVPDGAENMDTTYALSLLLNWK